MKELLDKSTSKNEDRPEYGKQYALTGTTGTRCIMNGNTWAELEASPVHLQKREQLQSELIEKQKEITQEMYAKMLNILPPERMTCNGFLVGEPSDHVNDDARYAMYIHDQDKYYYCGLATTKDFDMMIITR